MKFLHDSLPRNVPQRGVGKSKRERTPVPIGVTLNMSKLHKIDQLREKED